METDNNIELLEAYVNGTLTPAQQLQVEARLGNDAAFRHDYEFYQLMISAITENRRTELKSFISKNVKVKPALFFKTPTFYAAAAASVLLCVISYFVVYQKLTEQKNISQNQTEQPGIEKPIVPGQDSAVPVAENNTGKKPSPGNTPPTETKKEEAVSSTTEVKDDNSLVRDAMSKGKNNNPGSMSNKTDEITVEADKMQLDTFLSINRKIYVPKPKQYQTNADDKYAVVTTVDKRHLEIQFWQSPINYSGYKFSKNLLIIYGNFDMTQITFQELKDTIYMKYKNDYYKFNTSEIYAGMKKETDAKIIADLELKGK